MARISGVEAKVGMFCYPRGQRLPGDVASLRMVTKVDGVLVTTDSIEGGHEETRVAMDLRLMSARSAHALIELERERDDARARELFRR